MHGHGIIPVISSYRAFMFTHPLFQLPSCFSHISKTTRTADQINHMCGCTSDNTVDGEEFACVGMGKVTCFLGIVALR